MNEIGKLLVIVGLFIAALAGTIQLKK